MASKKVLANRRVTVLVGLASAIADWTKPTLAEMEALTNVSGAINWSSFDLNIQASATTDDRTLTDEANAQSRGYANFGGTLELVMPRPDDLTSVYRTAYSIFSTPRTELVVAIRYVPLNNSTPVAGSEWNIFRLVTDATSFGENDNSKFYTVNLIARDVLLSNYIVPPAVAVAPTVTVLDSSVAVGDVVLASAVYQGRNVTRLAEWSTSDGTLLELVAPGVFLALDDGAPTVAAKLPGSLASTGAAVTIA